jgi:hypothetical protein
MFQAILEALKGLGGGFTKGVGQSSGLSFGKDIPNLMTTKNPKTGVLSQVAVSPTTSLWQQVGQKLGASAMSSNVQSPSSPSLPSVDTSTRVQQSGGYQRKGQKSQMETLLEQLARR